MGKLASFIKVLQGDFSDKLQIPKAFSHYIPKEAPPKVILKGPSGCQWSVGLKGKGSHSPTFYLEAGWDKFVKDHSLKEDELLLFKYHGGIHFTVLIFEKTACEREDAFGVKNKVLDAKKGENLCPETENDPKIKMRSRAQFVAGNRGLAARKSGGSKGDPGSFTSKFPFFIKCLPGSCFKGGSSLMYIPTTFYGYVRRKEMVLRDPRGEKWPISVRNPAGRLAIAAAGWCAFCKANALKVGDICIFELREPSTFWVRIYPC